MTDPLALKAEGAEAFTALVNLQKPPQVFYAQRLAALYDDAKDKNDGNSLSIYQEVSDVLDALEEVPMSDDAIERADNLCGRLRLEYGANT